MAKLTGVGLGDSCPWDPFVVAACQMKMRHARFTAQAAACAEMFYPMEVLTIYVTTHEARTFAPFCAKLAKISNYDLYGRVTR